MLPDNAKASGATHMAMTNAERQARYRRKHLTEGTKTRREFVLGADADMALDRLARHYELPVTTVIERTIIQAEQAVTDGMNAKQRKTYCARPLMKEMSERFHESCSAAILQGTDAIYVARVPAGRIMSVAISIGSRLPAFHTSIGRAQLGFLDDDEIWRRLRSLRIESYTPSTITDVQALFERVCADRDQGFSIVDEELERGLRSIAVPVVDRAGQAVGALNLSTHSTRTTRNEMRERFLPVLRATADQISASIA